MSKDQEIIEAAMVRGAKLKARLLKRAGGLLTAREAAELLGTTESSLRRNHQLIFVTSGDRAGYPAFSI